MKQAIYAIATMDSKGIELAYIAQCLRKAGASCVQVDVGTKDPATSTPDVKREAVAAHHPQGVSAVLGFDDRGLAVTRMSEALVRYITEEYKAGKVAGVIGIGGSGGTAVITPAMQALPIGLPKVMVSTMAGGNVTPYVGGCDITMMYSVVDVAGINAVSRTVLANAAHAIAGMVLHTPPTTPTRTALGMTMFGVTTPCVNAVRNELESRDYDCLVFHATGTGGRAMEKLVASGMIKGVLDITTTEVADEVVGGVLPCGPARFEAILEARIPYVMSVGALDMVNFGAMETVPEQFRKRNLYVHNAQVTLMRTTADENRLFARWIAGKINRSRAPVTLLIPEKGVSMIDAPGQPFHDPQADAALFEELEKQLRQTPSRQIIRLPYHINDAGFATAVTNEFMKLTMQNEEAVAV